MSLILFPLARAHDSQWPPPGKDVVAFVGIVFLEKMGLAPANKGINLKSHYGSATNSTSLLRFTILFGRVNSTSPKQTAKRMNERHDDKPPPEFAHLFLPSDEKPFVGLVSEYLRKNGHGLRQISAETYIQRCREFWCECELDEVFCFKILVDTLVQENEPKKKHPWSGMEVVKDTPVCNDDLFCVAIGMVDEKGDFIDAPPGYDSSPKNPRSKRGVVVGRKSDVLAEEPNKAHPESYLVAMLDVLGFERKLKEIGLDAMQQLYDKLITVAVTPHVEENLWTPTLASHGSNLFSPALFRLPVRHAYFSDTLLFWVAYRPAFVAPFLERCCGVFCEALRLGLPLRGSVVAGRCVLHKKTSTYLGDALVEAAWLEKAQEWVGVTLGVSVRTIQFPFLMSQEPMIILGDPPLKEPLQEEPDKYRKLVSGLVLDWPRYWRGTQTDTPRRRLEELRIAEFQKYDNAIRFAEHSAQHADWFQTPSPQPPVFKG
jgi:hypothetical protein